MHEQHQLGSGEDDLRSLAQLELTWSCILFSVSIEFLAHAPAFSEITERERERGKFP